MLRQRSRRTYLKGLSVVVGSLSGCLHQEEGGVEERNSDANQSTVPGSSRTADVETGGKVETSTQHTTSALPLSAYSFMWTAELLENATQTHPPEVRLSLTNTASESVELGFGPTPPFSTPISTWEDAPNRLVLYHPDMGTQSAPGTRIDGCWQMKGDPRMAVNSILTVRRLQPGETLSETYTLYNMPDNEACFADGEYVFGKGITLRRQPDFTEMLLEVVVRTENQRIKSVTTKEPTIPVSESE